LNPSVVVLESRLLYSMRLLFCSVQYNTYSYWLLKVSLVCDRLILPCSYTTWSTVAPHVAVTVDYDGHLLLRTSARWAPKLQVHQKAYELRAPMMDIYFGAVTTTGATNTNQLQFGQTMPHSLLMSVVWVVQSKRSPVRYGWRFL